MSHIKNIVVYGIPCIAVTITVFIVWQFWKLQALVVQHDQTLIQVVDFLSKATAPK